MTHGMIAMLGLGSAAHPRLDELVSEFGWSVCQPLSLTGLRALSSQHDLTAVLFNAAALHLPWHEALREIRHAAPEALPVVCHRPSENLDWPALAEAGAFHSLLLPLDWSEARQSLGFVAAEQQQRSHITNVVSLVSRVRQPIRSRATLIARMAVGA